MGPWGDAYKFSAGSIELISIITTGRVAYELWSNPHAWSVGCLLHLPLIFFTFLFNITYLISNVLFLLDESLTCGTPIIRVLTYASMYSASSIMPTLIGVIFIPYYAIRKAANLKHITRRSLHFSFFLTTVCSSLIFLAMYLAPDVHIIHYGGDLFCAFDIYTVFYLIIGEVVPLFVFVSAMYFLYQKHILEINFDDEMGIFNTIKMNRALRETRRSMASMRSASIQMNQARERTWSIRSRQRSISRSNPSGLKSPKANPSEDRGRELSISSVKRVRRGSSAKNQSFDIVFTDNEKSRDNPWKDATFDHEVNPEFRRGSIPVDPEIPEVELPISDANANSNKTGTPSVAVLDSGGSLGIRPSDVASSYRISIHNPNNVELLNLDSEMPTETPEPGEIEAVSTSSYFIPDSPRLSVIDMDPQHFEIPARITHSHSITMSKKEYVKTSSELENMFSAFTAYWRHVLIVWVFVFIVNIGLFILSLMSILKVDLLIMDRLYFFGGISFKLCNVLACYVFFQNKTMQKQGKTLCSTFSWCICSDCEEVEEKRSPYAMKT